MDQGLVQYDFSQKSVMWADGFSHKPIVVQLLRLINIGVPQSATNAGETECCSDKSDQDDDKEDGEQRFENKYLEACDQVAINQQKDSEMMKSKHKSGQNRLFKYLLTDGRVQIIAIEVQPIYGVNLERTLPGSKLLLVGPIQVRRGIWLLKQANVRVLWENQDQPKMVPKMGFTEANQAILKPKAQLDLMKKAKEGFKDDLDAQKKDSEMHDESSMT